MKRINHGVGWAVLAALAVPVAAHAEAREPGIQCRGASFSTCASVSIGMVADRVSVEMGNPARAGRPGRTTSLPEWEYHPVLIPWRDETGRYGGKVPCPAFQGEPMNPADCPTATVVTPEPVSMALLATGLAGMVGAGAIRRRTRAGTGPQ